MNCETCGVESETTLCSHCQAAETVTKTEITKTCPHCNSENIEERGKKYFFQIGLYTLIAFLVIGFIMPILWVGALAGIFFMVAAPYLPKQYVCPACKKAFK